MAGDPRAELEELRRLESLEQKAKRINAGVSGTAPQPGMTAIDTPRSEAIRTGLQFGLPALAVAATAPFTGGMPAAAIYGTEALASLGSEALLQATGISEKDPNAFMAAGLAPGAGRLATTVLSQAKRLVPGLRQAEQKAQAELVRTTPAELLPGPSSRELYNLVGSGNVKAHLPTFPHLEEAVNKLGEDIGKVPWEKLQQDLRGTGMETLFEQITQSLKGVPAKITKRAPTISGKAESIPTGLPSQSVISTPAQRPGLSFEQATAGLEGFGRIIGRTSDDKIRGDYRQLYRALLTDLETMQPPPGTPVNVWQQARQAYKTEKARDLLGEQIEKSITSKEGNYFFDADKVVNWLKKSEDFKSRVDKPTFNRTIEFYREMARTEGKKVSNFIGLLAGASISHTPGGALAGYVASDSLSKWLLTPQGEAVAHALLKHPSRSLFRKFGASLGAGIAGGTDKTGTTDFNGWLPLPYGAGQLQPAP